MKKVDKKKVKRILNERLEEMRQDMESEGKEFYVDKEVVKAMKEDIEFALLPETEPEDFFNYVVLDKTTNLLYVLNGSKKVAEEITSFLRSVLG
ncbi:recombination-associated protein RdgC, partial [Escherichia coli]|uniref:recombination-associated protein RdgC n=1 Tax=Escherichia coli TaxID=562 RepID=UPI001CDA6186